MKLYRTLFSLLATLATAALPLAGQTKDFSQHIVWWDTDQRNARFVPGALLDGADLKNFQVPETQLKNLITRLENERNTRLQTFAGGSSCNKYTDSGLSAWSSVTGKDVGVTDFLSSKLVAFRGTVLELVPGWKIEFVPRVVTLVYIEVEEILVCNLRYLPGTRRIDAGDIVSVEMDKGSFEMNGLRVCNDTDDLLTVPKAGDEVVATGVPSAFDPYYAGPGAVFPIHLGEILPQPYEGLGRREPVSLAQTQETLGVALTPLSGCEALVP